MAEDLVSKEIISKLVNSSNIRSANEVEAVTRLHDCSTVYAEAILNRAMQAAQNRKSDTVEKCDIETAIALLK